MYAATSSSPHVRSLGPVSFPGGKPSVKDAVSQRHAIGDDAARFKIAETQTGSDHLGSSRFELNRANYLDRFSGPSLKTFRRQFL